MDISLDIDIALEELRNFIPSLQSFSSIEREFIEELRAYLLNFINTIKYKHEFEF